MWKCFFTRGQLKKIKNEKKAKSAPRKRICWVEWWWGYSGKKKLYEDANQTENFIGAKTKNYIYYKGEKHY